MPSSYFSWLAEKKKEKETENAQPQSFQGSPPYNYLCQCFWSLCSAKASGVGPTWSPSTQFISETASPLPSLHGPSGPASLCAAGCVQLPPRLSLCPQASLPGCLCTLLMALTQEAGLTNPSPYYFPLYFLLVE